MARSRGGGGEGQEGKGKEKKRDEDIHVDSEAYDWLPERFGPGLGNFPNLDI